MDSWNQEDTPNYYNIYRGIWTNWSRGPVFGLTLTLTRRNGDLLIAFVALFVTIVGTSFWRISCFFIHNLYSSEAPRDGLYHQRQAIFRNSANGSSGLVRLAQALWAWRQKSKNPFKRVLPAIAFTVVCICAWATASGLSSRISTGVGNEVLISSSNCGVVNTSGSPSAEFLETKLLPFYTKAMLSQSTYAQQCYAKDTNTNPANCQTFVKKRLTSQVNRNATCPFQPNMCRLQNGNIHIDTVLDTHRDLGLNLPQSQRLQIRITTDCAPIVMEGYKKDVETLLENQSDSNGSYFEPKTTTFYYGRLIVRPGVTREVTYEYKTPRHYLKGNDITAIEYYSIGYRYTQSKNGSIDQDTSRFYPVDGLRRVDADVGLIFLSANAILYFGEVNDPLYSAHQPLPGIHNSLIPNETITMYARDEPVAVLGCVAQYQVCNPVLPQSRGCTPPSGVEDLLYNAHRIAESEKEANIFRYYLEITLLQFNTPDFITYQLGEWSLASSYTLNQGLQAQLPDNQWQLDVEHWHEISMASLQSAVVDAATGPSDSSILEYWRGPETPRSTKSARTRYVCTDQSRPHPSYNQKTMISKPNLPFPEFADTRRPIYSLHADRMPQQKIRSNAHTNFSVFGLAFVFVTGTILILLSWFLEPCVAYIQKRGGWAWFCSCRCCFCHRKSHRHPSTSFSTSAYARLEWSANETLQLQRLAHEELGIGPWEACDSAVPVTARKGERLGVLDLEDWMHSRLKAPPRDLEEEYVIGAGEGEGRWRRDGARGKGRSEGIAGLGWSRWWVSTRVRDVRRLRWLRCVLMVREEWGS